MKQAKRKTHKTPAPQSESVGQHAAQMLRRRGVKGFLGRLNWRDFFTNFLAVVLGIVITLLCNTWIGEHNERKDLRNTLSLVCDELQENLNLLDEIEAQCQLELQAAQYLTQYYDRFEECENDSMRLYCNAPLTVSRYNISDNALELLKTSQLIQKIGNKELALDIIRAYNTIRDEQEVINYYDEKKQKLLDNAMESGAKSVFARNHFTAAEMWQGLTDNEDGRQFLHEIIISNRMGLGFDETRQTLQNIIQQIKQYIK